MKGSGSGGPSLGVTGVSSACSISSGSGGGGAAMGGSGGSARPALNRPAPGVAA